MVSTSKQGPEMGRSNVMIVSNICPVPPYAIFEDQKQT